ncbi:tyrosine-protein phosphatase [Baekduia soli]|uniref:Tyrosine-protein phosphatase n=1 Tax=Baekduia soli TaxID=496014 RepID=A0A5B8UBZ4_9ACTN|nr:tyrosine-protein phosphatase [Baekduia soli]
MVADTAPRWIELDGAVNARDLGGIPLARGGTTVPGRLLRSDNLQDLSAADVAHLVGERSLTAVIDLRTDVELNLEGPSPMSEEPRVVVEHRSLYPEYGERTDLEVDTVVPWQRGLGGSDRPGESPTVQTYMGYLEHRPDSIIGALRTIAAPPGGGAALVHCAAGKDRTGLVVAMALEVAGARREAVVGDYVATAQRIEAIIARLASTPTYAGDITRHDPARHAPRPETMFRILQLLDEGHGGTSGWLREHGMQDAELEALGVKLTAA